MISLSREVADDNGADLAPDLDTVAVGAAEVNTAPDARFLDLRGDLRQLAPTARDAEQRRVGRTHGNVVAAEPVAEHRLRSAGEDGVCRWIFRVRRCSEQRLPNSIAFENRRTVGRSNSGANGGDRSPVRASIF